MHKLFVEMAEKELKEALSALPSDSFSQVAIFIETIRILDYWSVFRNLLPKEKRLSLPDLTIIYWGWNLAIEHLYHAVTVPGAIPISKESTEFTNFAASLLYRFGKYVLLYRTSEMIKRGFMQVNSVPDGFTLKTSEKAKDQFLDHIELTRLSGMEKELINNTTGTSKGWQLVEPGKYSDVKNSFGSFIQKPEEEPLKDFKVDKVDQLMIPLIHPWDSGYGIMMGYDAHPEVDRHFLAVASELVKTWWEEAGLHPDVELGKVRGTDLIQIIIYLTSLHLKHIQFALLASKHYPEISIPRSLTIWEPFDQLEESIIDYSNLDQTTVRNALHVIALHPKEAAQIHKVTKNFVPLLINLDNGKIIRPVSSVYRNPFLSIITLQEWREPRIRDQISKYREEWLRSEIYAIFLGTRYRRIDGNIKIRAQGKVLTDIDAAIYDTLTGELGLFQIKWQDYFTNDVRELSSKASNLTEELDKWASKVSHWLSLQNNEDMIKTLRLKLNKGMKISSVYLFGISRVYARVQGFGYKIKSDNLAIASWPQFRRIRYETGPSEKVISALFDTLKIKMAETIPVTTPLPTTIKVSEKSLHFEDLWMSYGDV